MGLTWGVVSGFAVLLAISAFAHACDCGNPRDHEARVRAMFASATCVVLARVVSTRQTRERAYSGSDPLIVARLKVVRSLKGKPPRLLSVASERGDNGANCGFGNALVRATQSGPISLALGQRLPTGRYHVSGCSQGFGEHDLRAFHLKAN
jgi:hypothetical protein